MDTIRAVVNVVENASRQYSWGWQQIHSGKICCVSLSSGDNKIRIGQDRKIKSYKVALYSNFIPLAINWTRRYGSPVRLYDTIANYMRIFNSDDTAASHAERFKNVFYERTRWPRSNVISSIFARSGFRRYRKYSLGFLRLWHREGSGYFLICHLCYLLSFYLLAVAHWNLACAC